MKNYKSPILPSWKQAQCSSQVTIVNLAKRIIDSIIGNRPIAFLSLFLCCLLPKSEASLPEALAIEVKNVIDWDTVSGQTYQLQKSTSSNIWNNVGTLGQGDGNTVQHELDTLESGTEYRVVKTINENENPLAIWSAFADGAGTVVSGANNDIFTFPSSAQPWAGFANDETAMYPLSFSNGGTLNLKLMLFAGELFNLVFTN